VLLWSAGATGLNQQELTASVYSKTVVDWFVLVWANENVSDCYNWLWPYLDDCGVLSVQIDCMVKWFGRVRCFCTAHDGCGIT
jgi:hypothetical protein